MILNITESGNPKYTEKTCAYDNFPKPQTRKLANII
jgi:hypothetical protein